MEFFLQTSFQRAADLCRQDIRRTEDLPSLWATLGLLEAKLGHQDEARLWLERAAARQILEENSDLHRQWPTPALGAVCNSEPVTN